MKKLLAALAVAMLTVAAAGPAGAQGYPTKPIRLICPYPPGAGADTSARIMAEALSEKLGQQVVVENRTGVGGVIGVEYVAKAEPDGYTLGWPSADPISLVSAFRKNLPYDALNDFEYIGKFVETGLTFAISVNVPAKDMKEFIAYVKAQNGKVKSGTSGVAGSSDIASYLFEHETGTKMLHVPYKGIAPAMTDLLGGHVDLVVVTPSTVSTHVGSGKIRVLAVTSPTRHPLLPDVPTVKEAGIPGVESTSWYGLVAPKGTPKAVVDKLRAAFAEVVKIPEIKVKAEKTALQLAPLIGDDFKNAVAKEITSLKALQKAANIAVVE
jgi:tripartite-type tricarboxylate transporter receptor subunit TctC